MIQKYALIVLSCKKQKGYQHLKFPSGPPPQYLTDLKPLNFGVRKGSGVFGLVWPIAIIIVVSKIIYYSLFF